MSRGQQQLGGGILSPTGNMQLFFRYQDHVSYMDLSPERSMPYLYKPVRPEDYNNPSLQMNLLETSSTTTNMPDAPQYRLRSNSGVYLILDYSHSPPILKAEANLDLATILSKKGPPPHTSPQANSNGITAILSIRQVANTGNVAMYFKVGGSSVYFVKVDPSRSPWSLIPKQDTESNWRQHVQFGEFFRNVYNCMPKFPSFKLRPMAIDQTDAGEDNTYPEMEEQLQLMKNSDRMELESDTNSSDSYTYNNVHVEQESDPDSMMNNDDNDSSTQPGMGMKSKLLESYFDVVQTDSKEEADLKKEADSESGTDASKIEEMTM